MIPLSSRTWVAGDAEHNSNPELTQLIEESSDYLKLTRKLGRVLNQRFDLRKR